MRRSTWEEGTIKSLTKPRPKMFKTHNFRSFCGVVLKLFFKRQAMTKQNSKFYKSLYHSLLNYKPSSLFNYSRWFTNFAFLKVH